ncbi:MAG TPA: C40 family peptidase, partial [Gemmatimonadales bacterium]|nr:C40 family peptidase [Gemmatimonadales bacterium]
MAPRLPFCALAVASLTASAPAAAAQQAFEGQVGRFYDDAGWTLYRLGVRRPLGGPMGLAVHGSYLTREGDGEGAFAGVGADLTAFRGGSEGPYVIAGLGGGLGSPHGRSFSSFWGSWSAGAGYELFPASFLAFNAEARWRELSLDHRDGMEVAAGLSFRFGGSRPRDVKRDAGSTPVLPVSAARDPVSLRDSVVAAATEAMGRPYRFGGTGESGGGFDCSGLIQYAYGQHGVPLPRTSAEQAKEGRKLPKRMGELEPGDLLTFSNRGGAVTHVGMYLGEGKFIHSATRGVQVSVLSDDDPYGRWWYQRWVGARRILDS